MDQKYWVPALERADLILKAISRQTGALKMTDLCEETGINKKLDVLAAAHNGDSGVGGEGCGRAVCAWRRDLLL
ncbi:hypothetical protein ACFTAO_31900 [Paenibacillus rhizoplanae]